MDPEEEGKALTVLGEEADQLHTLGLYSSPFPSAEFLPQDTDGAYGTNFVETLGSVPNRSCLGQLQSFYLLPRSSQILCATFFGFQ